MPPTEADVLRAFSNLEGSDWVCHKCQPRHYLWEDPEGLLVCDQCDFRSTVNDELNLEQEREYEAQQRREYQEWVQEEAAKDAEEERRRERRGIPYYEEW